MDGFSATTLSQTARIKTAPFLDIALRELLCLANGAEAVADEHEKNL